MTDYFFSGEAGIERLQVQVEVWEPDAEALLDRITIQPGWVCLDLGCGVRGILAPLAKRVGPSGRVVGADLDVAHLAAARTYVLQEGLANVELHKRDVIATRLPRDSFDFVHARFLFPLVDSAPHLLTEMIDLTRPGGIVAVQERDHSSWNFYPSCEKWPRLVRLLEETTALRSDINIGRQMFSMLRDAGLEEVQVRAAVVALQDCHPYMSLPVVMARTLRDEMLAARQTTTQEFDELVQAAERCAQDPARMHLTFTVIQVWGRKPLPEPA